MFNTFRFNVVSNATWRYRRESFWWINDKDGLYLYFEMDIFCKINVTALEKNKFFTLVFNKCPRFLGNE